jgi:hypothetical protein
MLFPLCLFLLPHMHNLNTVPSCFPFRLDLGYLCIEFCMGIRLYDCNRHRGHRLRVEETVCNMVLHLRFPMRNGGHYTLSSTSLPFLMLRVKMLGKGNKLIFIQSSIKRGLGNDLHLLQATSGVVESPSQTKITPNQQEKLFLC